MPEAMFFALSEEVAPLSPDKKRMVLLARGQNEKCVLYVCYIMRRKGKGRTRHLSICIIFKLKKGTTKAKIEALSEMKVPSLDQM